MGLRKHVGIGFFRTLGVGLALLFGALILLIIALITGANLEFMGVTITQ